MKFSPVIFGLLLVSAATLPIVIAAQRLNTAEAQLAGARVSLMRVRHDVQLVQSLRARTEQVASQRRPDEDISLLVKQVMTNADIPLSRFRSLSTQSDAAVTGQPGYARHDVRLTMSRIQMPRLGDFLVRFQDAGPLWTVSRIEITHARGASAEQFDVTLVISALYTTH